jgi:hypothetical protein
MIKKFKKIALIAFSISITVGVLGCGGGGGGGGDVSATLPWSALSKPAGMTSPSLQGTLTGGDGSIALLLPPLSPDVNNAKLWVISSTNNSSTKDSLTVLTASALNNSTMSAKGRRYDLRSNFGATSTSVDLQGTLNPNTTLGTLSFNNSTVYSFTDNLNRGALLRNMRRNWKGLAEGGLQHELYLTINPDGYVTGYTTQNHNFTGQLIARNDFPSYQVTLNGDHRGKKIQIDAIALLTENFTQMQLLWVLTDMETGATSGASYLLDVQ